MSRRRQVVLAIGAALLVGGAAAYLLWPDAAHHRASFEAIRLGMDRETVEEMVQPLTEWSNLRRKIDFAHRRQLSVEWEGMVAGEPQTVRYSGMRGLPEPGDPMFDSLLLVSTQVSAQADGSLTGTIRRSGRVLGTMRAWQSPTDELLVVFDPDGRVVEREYITFRVESPWFRRLRDLFGLRGF